MTAAEEVLAEILAKQWAVRHKPRPRNVFSYSVTADGKHKLEIDFAGKKYRRLASFRYVGHGRIVSCTAQCVPFHELVQDERGLRNKISCVFPDQDCVILWLLMVGRKSAIKRFFGKAGEIKAIELMLKGD